MRLIRLQLRAPARVEATDDAGRPATIDTKHVDCTQLIVERVLEGYEVRHPSSNVVTFVPVSNLEWAQWVDEDAKPRKRKPAAE